MIKDIISIPFDILTAAQGESKVGYAFLMIIFLSGFVTMTYYIFDFLAKVISGFFRFLSESWEALLSVFKRKPIKQLDIQSMLKEHELKLDKIFNTAVDEINNKIEKLNKNRMKDIL